MTEAEFKARLAAAARRIPPDVLAGIAAAHEGYGYGCSAASEGLACCLDWVAVDQPKED